MLRRVRIRSRTTADLARLVELARAVHDNDGYPPYLPDNDFEGFLSSGEPIDAWVAASGEEVIGHISLHAESSPGVIDLAADALGVGYSELGVIARLLVDPRQRRSGSGRLLLEHATAECRRRNLTPILDVVDRFAGAISLYEATGWTRLGSVDVRLPDGSAMREHVYAAPHI